MRGKVFTLASVALLSCRAVLGIEELEDTPDGGPSMNGDSGADSGVDAGRDAPPATTDGGGDATNACASMPGNDCGRCCRDKDKEANKRLQDLLRPCTCEAGVCAACPNTDVCGGSSSAAGTDCIPCLDRTIRADSCPDQRKQCGADQGCKAVYDCIHACPE